MRAGNLARNHRFSSMRTLVALVVLNMLGITAMRLDAQVVSEPPEPRITLTPFSFPEYQLTRQSQQAAEWTRSLPIRDAEGRIRYWIDLTDDAADAYQRTSPPDDGMPEYNKPEARHLLQALARQYSLRPYSMISWIGNGFSAHLDDVQISALEKDPRVTRITPDRWLRKSGSLWTESTGPNGQILSWGTNALGGSRASPNDVVTLYVLDTGIGVHADLPSIISRNLIDPFAQYPVGCYAHATAIAGIASGQNTVTSAVWGMNRGVPIVSYALNNSPSPTTGDNCSISGAPLSLVHPGLDMIKADIAARGRMGVINISLNDAAFRSTGTFGQRFLNIATPAPGYPGALIVQSAGNTTFGSSGNACDVSYDVPSNVDGIIVVGGIDENGQQAVKLNGFNAYRNAGLAQDAEGSNHGSCVEMWAPSKSIYTTWGDAPTQTGPPTVHSTRTRLSGTSFAAPHIAALAAYTNATWGPVSPQGLEFVLGYNFGHFLDSQDKSGRSIWIPWAFDNPPTTAKALPTAEFRLDDRINPNPFPPFDSTHQFYLSYDSRGAQSCTLSGYKDGGLWYTVPNYFSSYDWTNGGQSLVQLDPGSYQWHIDCVSAHGTHNTAVASVTIVPPPPAPPTATWTLNGVPRNGQTVWIPGGTLFTFRYDSTSATGCSLYAEKGPYPGPLQYWYDVPFPFYTSYDWGSQSLPPYFYKWTVSCIGPGGSVQEFLQVVSY